MKIVLNFLHFIGNLLFIVDLCTVITLVNIRCFQKILPNLTKVDKIESTRIIQNLFLRLEKKNCGFVSFADIVRF